MKKTILIALWAVSTLSARADDDQSLWEAFAPYEKTIRRVDGVLEITAGEVRGERGLLIRVRSQEAKEGVRILLGDRVGSFPVQVFLGTVTAPAGPSGCTHCPLHCGGGTTAATPAKANGPGTAAVDTSRLEDPAYAQERCDVIRKWLRLPRLEEGDIRCQEMVGTTNNPARIRWVVTQGFPHWRSQELSSLRGSDATGIPCAEHGIHSGETISYAWIKHRQSCPLGARQLLKEIEDQSPTQGPRK